MATYNEMAAARRAAVKADYPGLTSNLAFIRWISTAGASRGYGKDRWQTMLSLQLGREIDFDLDAQSAAWTELIAIQGFPPSEEPYAQRLAFWLDGGTLPPM